MGLLTALRIRPPYVVTVRGVPGFPVERFRSLADARAYADHVTVIARGAVCLITRADSHEVLYSSKWRNRRLPPEDGREDGSSGVREPRRPVPGSSAGAIELDLP
jgi:hypothetical protein